MGRARRWRVRPLKLMRALFLLALGVWLGQGWLASTAAWVAVRLGPTDVGHWGELLEAYPGWLVVVRQERLLAAPASGRVVFLVSEGQSVASGTPLARIEPEEPGASSQTIVAPFSGVASFVGDGWEAAFSVESPGDPALLQGQDPRPRPLVPRGEVARGEPVVRLVDRRELYAVFWSEAPLASARIGEGARVELVEGDASDGIPAQVVEGSERASTGPARLVVRLDRHPVDWLYRRVIRGVRLVAARYQGVVLPVSGLVERGGKRGYWLATEGGPVFVTVQVVERLGRQVVVRGVPDGVRVYRWPRWLQGF